MKSPLDLRTRLAAQWKNNDLREARILLDTSWPIILPIGKPPANIVAGNLDALRTHIQSWRSEKTGTVVWQDVTYRATGEPIDIPIRWEIHSIEDWIAAASLNPEAKTLLHLLENTAPRYHSLLTRHRSLWKNQDPAETAQACLLADLLEPDCAGGAPLRAIPLAGIDTKFFERNRNFIIRLLDLRFDGEATRLGLEEFLGAWKEGDHWLLLADLDGCLLAFPQVKVRSHDLKKTALGAPNILIVENEKCLHLLPQLPGTIAILGAGLNLAWLSAEWLNEKKIAYWGDLDTWGLTMLAQARAYLPDITPILMTGKIFECHASESAVIEPVSASTTPPSTLTLEEQSIYRHLLSIERNRLEQEFINQDTVSAALKSWLNQASS